MTDVDSTLRDPISLEDDIDRGARTLADLAAAPDKNSKDDDASDPVARFRCIGRD